ncbi:MAG TPA: SGNH/GDSL hydrolase family protein [Hymenobacter sp.]|jgi:lysophospholipase L1-like esterase|uniref:SGNH/GDSL hydrolase family protein n=1 Tax=Hymenobacter sp. TaxID=1898978 RepID=UPI002ED8FFAA
MKNLFLALLLSCTLPAFCRADDIFYPADDKRIQYVGRIDFSDAKKPRFWPPGVYVTLRFRGPSCEVSINDEVLYGKNHNYLEVVVDGKPRRLQLKDKTNVLPLTGLADAEHTLVICKNTESNIGYLEFVGVKCRQLLAPAPLPRRKIEFIGNSITCGTGSDQSEIPCGKGVWHDQHNAYLAYGPTVARALNAQWSLTAVSGIGLMHSCCNMDVVMPQVFDKVSLRENKIAWNFQQYQPDVVTVCLGQNDGIQDSVAFCRNYGQFLKTLRGHYPKAEIVCLTSPMGDAKLTAALKNYLTSIVRTATAQGDKKVHSFFFANRYTAGCDSHPSLAEHQLIAKELAAYVQSITRW